MRTLRLPRRADLVERTPLLPFVVVGVLLLPGLLLVPIPASGSVGFGPSGNGVDESGRDAHVSILPALSPTPRCGGFPPSLTVSILLPTGPVDPLTPFSLNSTVDCAFGQSYNYAWSDSLGDSSMAPSFTITAPASGSVEIGLRVWDIAHDVGTANATIGVGSFPSIEISAGVRATDIGLPIPLTIRVAGGLAPYDVTWQPLPGGTVDSATLLSASEIDTTTIGRAPGFEWVRASVTDHLRVETTIEAIVANVHPRPQLMVAAVAREVDVGAMAEVSGLVLGGTPPFTWTAAASLPAVEVSGASGSAGPSDPVAWTGRFSVEGNATVAFEVNDAAGLPVSGNSTIRVFSTLLTLLAVETPVPAAGSPLNLSWEIRGGVPPYDYAVELSDGERTSGTEPAAGPVSWTAHPVTAGYLGVRLSAQDGVLGSSLFETTVLVGPAAPGRSAVNPPAPPTGGSTGSKPVSPPSGGSSSETAATFVALGLGGLLVAGWFFLDRQRRRTRGTNPDAAARAMGVVRHILEDSEGVEPSTLRLLAEEEGVGGREVEGALARWEAAGRVRSDPAADGLVRIGWIPSAPLPPRSTGDPEGA